MVKNRFLNPIIFLVAFKLIFYPVSSTIVISDNDVALSMLRFIPD